MLKKLGNFFTHPAMTHVLEVGLVIAAKVAIDLYVKNPKSKTVAEGILTDAQGLLTK